MKAPAYSGRPLASLNPDPNLVLFHQNGHGLLEESTAFEAAWKVSEIVNPDGSITVRRKVVSPSGNKVVREEEYEHFDQYQEAKRLHQFSGRAHLTSSSTDSCTSSNPTPNATPKNSPARPPKQPHRVTWGPTTPTTPTTPRTATYADDAASSDESFLTSSSESSTPTLGPKPTIGRKPTFAARKVTENNQKIQSCLKLPANDGYVIEHDERLDFRPRPTNPMSVEVDQPKHATNREGQGLSAVSELGDPTHSQYDPYDSEPEMSALTEPSHHFSEMASAKRASDPRIKQQHNSSSEVGDILDALALNNNSNVRNSLPRYDSFAAKREMLSNHQSQIFSVTIVKDNPDAKIGMRVGMKYFTCGPRLIVTDVSPDGPLMNTPVQIGDMIVTVNGKDCIHRPNTAEVLEIVRAAKEVTIMIRKRCDNDDFHSVDDISEASRQYALNKKMLAYTSNNARRRKKQEESERLQIDNVEVVESTAQKSTRRTFLNADGSVSHITDRLHSKETSVVSRELVSVSGDLILSARKLEANQDVGLTVTKKSTLGLSSLVVSKIAPGSLFADTPLRVGDAILVVNNQDFRENPSAIAATTALTLASGELTICIRKSPESLNDFISKIADRAPNKGGIHAVKDRSGVKKKEKVTFDEVSYDGSMGGYNSSKSILLRKSYPSEDLGLEFDVHQYGLDSVLVVASVPPTGSAASGELQMGDVILSINGSSFQEQPNSERAAQEIRDARSQVLLEYQRFPVQMTQPAITRQPLHPIPEVGNSPTRRQFTVPATVDGSADISSGVEGFSQVHAIDDNRSTVSALGSALGGISEVGPRSSEADYIGAKHETASTSSKSSQISMPVLQRQFVELITVAKSHPDDDVGLSMVVANGALRVEEVSPIGLLAGRPILPGDTITAINGKSFVKNPNVAEAAEMVANSPVLLTLEIKRPDPRRGGEKPRKAHKWCKKIKCSKRIYPE